MRGIFPILEIALGSLSQKGFIRQGGSIKGGVVIVILFMDQRPDRQRFKGLKPARMQFLKVLFRKGIDLRQIEPVAQYHISITTKHQVIAGGCYGVEVSFFNRDHRKYRCFVWY